ncbi:hypothetical protein [Streptomyces californicus]|uniref:hypothetical protein n=1 Tax=Streptomyces californicus TaxID=67351 RepID=UPI00296EE650|nr:hypothetical protein [Streptomyces californicus]MDW4916404.1 hypothetical protein [Streptomyces californicus]
MAELTNALSMSPASVTELKGTELDGAMILAILAVFGVLSIMLYALKGFLDQLPEFFASLRRAWEAWQELKRARRRAREREAALREAARRRAAQREAAEQQGSQSQPAA